MSNVTTIGSSYSSILTITNFTRNDSGNYSCTVSVSPAKTGITNTAVESGSGSVDGESGQHTESGSGYNSVDTQSGQHTESESGYNLVDTQSGQRTESGSGYNSVDRESGELAESGSGSGISGKIVSTTKVTHLKTGKK